MEQIGGSRSAPLACAVILTLTGQPAARSTSLDLIGTTFTVAPGTFYGAVLQFNDVLNSAGVPGADSVPTDLTGPQLTADTPWVIRGGLSTRLTDYLVDWFYAGSKSGNATSFDAGGLSGDAGHFTETDSNCRPACPARALEFHGKTQNSLSFGLSWNGGQIQSNSRTLPTDGMPGPPPSIGTNPLPAALSLFTSVIGGGIAFGAWRKFRRRRRRRSRRLAIG